jgi:hypothetical protein
MAKNKISEWDATASGNTDVGGININEGCPPSTINNAMREIMAQIKDQQTGYDGDNFTVGGNLSVSGTSNFVGNATAVTQLDSDNSTKLATTAYVQTKNAALGTIATQDASSVNITGGSITGLTSLSTSSGNISSTTITASGTLVIGTNWTAVQSGTDLIFKYSGTNKMKIDSSGNLTVVGDVTAFGSL